MITHAEAGAFVERFDLAPTGHGALDGLRVAVKDLIDVAGFVTGGGNPDWRKGQARAARAAPAVEQLLAAGARLVGKTMTDELAFSLEGANDHYGTPLNPRARGRLPGGSSSGSASAVAAGLADVALGTDTGGSVRVPASFCGLYGFRPTHGLVSLDGVVPFAPSYDTIGWFARSQADLARVTHVLVADQVTPVTPRFVIVEDAFAMVEPAVAQALLDRLPKALRAAPRIRVFDERPQDWREAYRVLQGAEIWANLGGWITAARPRFGASIAARFEDAATISEAEVAHWTPWRAAVRERLWRLVGRDGILVFPTAPCIAPLEAASGDEIGAFYQAALPITSIAGHAGLPQLSLPLAEVDSCPVGLSLAGPRGTDRWLVDAAGRVFKDVMG